MGSVKEVVDLNFSICLVVENVPESEAGEEL